MVQNYTPVMWDDKAFAFVPYEAFSDLPHYPKVKISPFLFIFHHFTYIRKSLYYSVF